MEGTDIKDRPGAVGVGTVVCARCGRRQGLQQYHCFDAAADRGAVDILMDGGFFRWTCPDCGEYSELAYPSRYLDRENKLNVVLRPDIGTGDCKELLEDMNRCLEGLDREGVRHRAVENFHAMQEQVRIRESEMDDRVVQLIKPLIIGQLQNRGMEVWNGFFVYREPLCTAGRREDVLYMFENGTGEEAYAEPVLWFDIYLTNGEITRQGVNIFVYKICENMLYNHGDTKDNGDYQFYDLTWAIDFHNGIR